MKPSVMLILTFLGTSLFTSAIVSLHIANSYKGVPYLEFGATELITIAMWVIMANVFTLGLVTSILASEGKFAKKKSEEPPAIKYEKLRRVK